MDASDRYHTLAAVLLGTEVVLTFTGLGLLRARLGWPNPLRWPAAQMLGAASRQQGVIIGGYTSYLLGALLLVPISAALYAVLAETDVSRTTLAPSLALAAAGGLTIALGTARWISVVPELARTYTSDAVSETMRTSITITFLSFDTYGTVLAQTIGLGLLTALFVLSLSRALLASNDHPDWLGQIGYVASALLFLVVPTSLGLLPMWVLALATIAVQFWYAGLAVVVFLEATPEPDPGPDEEGGGGDESDEYVEGETIIETSGGTD